jgi:hypothetical protein
MMNSLPLGKKVAAVALAALTMGAGLTMTAGQAEARDGRKGALIAAGVLGALAVGAIAAQANESRYGYVDDGHAADDVYAPGYHQPRTVYQQPVQYYAPHPGYGYHRPHRPRHPGYSETGYSYRGPVCKLKKQQVWDGYGWRFQRVQVCR